MSRGAALVLCLAAVACARGTEYPVTLEVRDGWVREPGAECAGSRPFLFAHRDAPFRVETPRGASVASGELPAGTAVEALRQEVGAPRVPTFCRFRFSLSLPGRGRYRFELEGGVHPLELVAGRGPVTLIIP